MKNYYLILLVVCICVISLPQTSTADSASISTPKVAAPTTAIEPAEISMPDISMPKDITVKDLDKEYILYSCENMKDKIHDYWEQAKDKYDLDALEKAITLLTEFEELIKGDWWGTLLKTGQAKEAFEFHKEYETKLQKCKEEITPEYEFKLPKLKDFVPNSMLKDTEKPKPEKKGIMDIPNITTPQFEKPNVYRP